MKTVVIGAGIGGLSAALALKRAGHQVEIYERVPQIKSVGAGISLWANAVYALDQLGVGDKLRAHGLQDLSGGFHTPRGNTLLKMNTDQLQQRFYHPTIVIHRADLSQLLMDALHEPISLNKTFVRYEESGQRVLAYFEDGTQAEADLLICADGLHSLVRQQWFPQRTPRYAGYTVWRGVTHYAHDSIFDMWGETLGCGLRFGIAPLIDNQIYWFVTQTLPEGEAIPDAHAHLSAQFGTWAAPIPDLIRQTPAEAILRNDVYDIEPLPYWVKGHLILLGDSAHAMTPNMGQGGCQAIEDAVMLGKCLSQKPTLDEALAAYQNARLPHANRVLIESRQLGNLLSAPHAWQCVLRDIILRVTPSQIQVQRLAPIIGHQV